MENNDPDRSMPDPSQPWCSRCSRHTEGRTKLFSLDGGEGGIPSYKCAECKSTMWAPDDLRGGRLVVVFFFVAVLASTIALPIYLGVNWMSIVIVLGDAGIFL